jgi:GTPase SAR1 family protein
LEFFERNLDRYREARREIAGQLDDFAARISTADGDGALTLPEVAANLRAAAETLRSGIFRLMLLGDMKRGKSTLLNALLGEDLLPARVTPCTAIITTLRYGETAEVTVHYRDRPPERISVAEFRSRYVISDEEAKAFEATGRHTFPDVDYAVISHSLGLLEKNVEFVDSPGLNDTEERNKITFDYLPKCHAALFVLSAMQPFTRVELEYLEEHLSGRGYTIFFLVNFWNQLKDTVLRPTDLAAQEQRLRRLLRENLARYCRAGDRDLYDARVFEIDALGALRGRLRGSNLDALPETGVPGFVRALNDFLLADRGQAELQKAAGSAEAALDRLEEAVRRRRGMLRQPLEELRQRAAEVEPQFEELQRIRGRIAERISAEGSRQGEAIAVDFQSFLTDIHQGFEAEFPTFAPPVRLQSIFSLEKRQEFEQAVNDAFRRYMAAKVDAWRQRNDERLRMALAALGQDIGGYGRDYQAVVEHIDAVVHGAELEGHATIDPDALPAWTRYATAAAGLFSGEVNTSGVGSFEWKEILLNLGAVIGLNILMAQMLGIFAGPVGLIVSALLVGGAQLRQSMSKLTADMREKLQEQLPKFASEKRGEIKAAVEEAFGRFRERVDAAVQGDIEDLRHELDSLVKQMESQEFNARQAEEQLDTLLDGAPGRPGVRALVEEARASAAAFEAG